MSAATGSSGAPATPLAEGPANGGSSVPARGTIQLLAARLAFVAIGFAVSVVISRSLDDKASFGTYNVCLSLVVFLEMASNAGLQAATGRRFQGAGALAGVVEASARRAHLLVSTVVFGLAFLAAPWIAAWLGLGTFLVRLAILDLPLAGLYFAEQGIQNARRGFGVLALGFVAYAATKLAGVLALVALGVTVEGALIVNVVATVGGLVWFGWRGRVGPGAPPRARADGAMMWSLVRAALPMGAYVVLLQAPLYFDQWFLKALGPSEAEVGSYTAAVNPARALQIVPAALSGVVFASLARALAHGDRALAAHHVRTGGRFALIVLVPAALLVGTHAEGIMTFVYGSRYVGSGRLLGLLVALFALAGVLDAYANALMAAGRERVVATLIALGVAVALVLDVVLVPSLGGEGAAYASLGGIALATAGVLAIAAGAFERALPLATLLRVSACAGVTALVGSWIPTSGLLLVVELAFLGLLYVALLFPAGELERADLRRVLPW